MNFNDIKTLSWQSAKGFQYDINDISQSTSTDVNETTDNDNYDNESNKLDNAVDYYFSNKRVEILRNNSAGGNSTYSDIPDNTSSCGEPSLSRYIDNDSLLKYESTRSKSAMYNYKPDKFNNNNVGKHSSLSSSIPSLSRFNIKNISSSIKSRSNKVHDSSNSSIYTSSENIVFSNTNQKDYPKVKYPSTSSIQSSDNKQTNHSTYKVDINNENHNLNYKIYQKSNTVNDIDLIKQNTSTSSSLSSLEKSKLSNTARYDSSSMNNNEVSDSTDDISTPKPTRLNKLQSNNYFTSKDSMYSEKDETFSSDSSNDIEDELEDINLYEQNGNQSSVIDLNYPYESTSTLNINIPEVSYKNNMPNDLPTIIVNTQNAPTTPTESVCYHY